MIDLITTVQAKAQIHEVTTTKDAIIAQKIAEASEIVMDYIEKETVPAEWVVDSSPPTYDIPALIQSATLSVFGELFANRESSNCNPLSDHVKNMLRRWRDPAMA